MKKQLLFFIAIFVSVSYFSCTYDAFEEEELPPVDTTKVYSFATDVQPIFTNNCVSCHGSSGGLNLEEGKAYGNVVPERVNLDSPDESKIYDYVKPGSATHSYEKYSGEDAQTVLQWIKQGAENN